MTINILNKKVSEVENKIPDVSSLVTTAVLNTKIGVVEEKFLIMLNLLLLKNLIR